MSFIKADRLTKIYGKKDAAVTAVDDISFTVDTGEFVGLMGESGAGKTTVLSIMGAMNPPTRGQYMVDGIDVYALNVEKQANFRREYLGFVFQSFHLVPYLNVMENVMLPLVPKNMPPDEKKDMTMAALKWVHLDNKANRLPNAISGGEKERVALARAIVNNPPIILADEPTGNLDSKNTRSVMELLQKLNDGGSTIIMVTHSEACASYAHRILQVADGKIRSGAGHGQAGTGHVPSRRAA